MRVGQQHPASSINDTKNTVGHEESHHGIPDGDDVCVGWSTWFQFAKHVPQISEEKKRTCVSSLTTSLQQLSAEKDPESAQLRALLKVETSDRPCLQVSTLI